jgi:hypothetical protein
VKFCANYVNGCNHDVFNHEKFCAACRALLSKPVRKGVSVSLDAQLGTALREHAKAVRLPMNEIVYRALVCYWTAQKTKEGTEALDIADLRTDEAWDSYLSKGEFSEKT